MIPDGGFLRRVYRLCVLVWLAVGTGLAALGHWEAVAGWTAGSGMSAGLTRITEAVIAASFAPGMQTGRRNLARLYFAKLPVVAVVLALLLSWAGRSPGAIVAMLCGVALPQIAMVAEALRTLAATRSGS